MENFSLDVEASSLISKICSQILQFTVLNVSEIASHANNLSIQVSLTLLGTWRSQYGYRMLKVHFCRNLVGFFSFSSFFLFFFFFFFSFCTFRPQMPFPATGMGCANQLHSYWLISIAIGGLHCCRVGAKTKENLLRHIVCIKIKVNSQRRKILYIVPNHQHGRHDITCNQPVLMKAAYK